MMEPGNNTAGGETITITITDIITRALSPVLHHVQHGRTMRQAKSGVLEVSNHVGDFSLIAPFAPWAAAAFSRTRRAGSTYTRYNVLYCSV